MGVNVVYTYTMKSGKCSKSPKGQKAVCKKLAQQEVHYTTNRIYFTHPACTNSNKGA